MSVYFLRPIGMEGPIKIGYSTNLPARLVGHRPMLRKPKRNGGKR